MDHITAIILAAGKGTRMQSTDKNKVSLEVNGVPMLKRTLNILHEAKIQNIVVVVGFAKESVINILDENVILTEQKEMLGTGDAVKVALSKVPQETDCVLILYGDDAFLHSPETYRDLYKTHKREDAKITFITMDMKNPTGYGRIIRNENNEVIGIVEEKNATDNEKKIKEINLGCYLIDKSYLEKHIEKIERNSVTGEYYITDLIDIIAQNKNKIAVYKIPSNTWRGINTKEDLEEVERMLLNN